MEYPPHQSLMYDTSSELTDTIFKFNRPPSSFSFVKFEQVQHYYSGIFISNI